MNFYKVITVDGKSFGVLQCITNEAFKSSNRTTTIKILNA